MDMPKPGDAHARLHKLVGEWSGGETLHPAPWDPTGGAADAQVNNRAVLDGFAVVQEYEQYRNGERTFSGHGLFWWDPNTSQYVMTWFDSMMGTPADFRGDFDGDVLRLANAMPQGGFSRCSFDCTTPGQYTFLMEVSPDGENWAPAMEGIYELQAAAGTSSSGRAMAAGGTKAARKAAPAKKAKPAKKAAKPARKAAASKKAAPRKKVAPKKKAAKPARKAAKKAGRKR